ncbi:MAG: YraN family protein [Candidatus Heteroscillospira sp.]|jgi:putative endonuclease
MRAESTKLKGARGEETAAEYLRRKGYTVVGLNYRVRGGEIDIIAQNRKYLVFVEVKTRKSARFAQGREYVTPAKMQRLILAAQLYLASNPTRLQPRFDVIEVYAPEDGALTVEHIENAFSEG